jgi:hypothetical protein
MNFFPGVGDQQVGKVIGLHAETFAARDFDERPLLLFR